jgi:hypothetical protein
MLVHGTAKDLTASIDVMNDVAEVRKAKEAASVVTDMDTEQQAEWVKELRDRTRAAPAGAPAVCVLDTGVNRRHPLLDRSLGAADLHACDPAWRTNDHHGHGTEMAGLALYGDIRPHLASSDVVRLRHVLESVKILPPDGNPPNPPELYGAITADAANRVEIAAPDRRRCFSLAVSATDARDAGRPSSWSAAIDALAAGRAFESNDEGLTYLDEAEEGAKRLFVVCAGNVTSEPSVDHLTLSDTEAVHDPGQAWNVLTVGAFTNLTQIDADLDGWAPVARNGELSPYSATSATFEKPWPIKPDMLLEGGNMMHSPSSGEVVPGDSLSMLTTYYNPTLKPFVASWGTSAATAQAARMAAELGAEYPTYWPETIRALLVHSAEWTPRMRTAIQRARTAASREALFRRYGFGVANMDRALHSGANALTLVVQDTIHPFDDGKLNQMHVHGLPWPTSVLEEYGDLIVRLRVTLSYFVEPNPARRGWKKRHRYSSHGLRFDVKRPTETVIEFRKRLNQQALDEEDERPNTAGDRAGWALGETARSRGSLHADVWEGTAADLAARGCIGIFPITGWWKEQPKRDRSAAGARYSLIVSIETDAVDLDIWTPVAELVGIPIE